MWKNIVPSGTSSTVLAGTPRGVRSDEWLTQASYFFAQSADKTPYSINNSRISLSGQNMILSYGAPVWDISTLAKPLNWGFLLFGPAYGLAWYWNLKILLLLLLSFEFCMILTRKHTLISILGSVWVAFSPAVQWWFMQHVCDVLLYMEAIVVLFACYLKNVQKPLWLKLLIAFGFGLSCVGFALTMYPAIQVPLAYLGFALIVVIFISMRKTVRLRRSDCWIAVGTVLFMGVMLGHVYLVSKDAIHAILNTAYPGRRVSNGGEGQPMFADMFLANPFLPFKGIPATISNNCEASSFYNFLPAVLLALPLLIKKRVGNLKYGVTLAVFSLLCLFYLYVHIPVGLAKITLLSFVTYRIEIAYGIASMFLSIWALAEISRLPVPFRISKIYALLCAAGIGVLYFLSVYFTPLKGYVRLRYYLVFILVMVLLNFCLLRGGKWIFSVVMTGVVLISGAIVNPVNVGVGAVYNNDLSYKVRQMVKANPDARWISLDNLATGDYLFANGACSLSGTNYYPDMKKWKVLDSSGQYQNTYNRYAHVVFHLGSGTTAFSNPTPDSLLVDVNAQDLKELQVRYILTSAPIEQYQTAGIRYTNLTTVPVDGYYIYELNTQ